jgi:hypothetical protein
MPLPPNGLSFQVFAPLLGQSFALVDGDSETALELVSVQERPEFRSGPEFRVPFFLEFSSLSPTPKPQRIYRLKHAALGEIELFLVPLRRDAKGCLYQSTFN